MDHLPIFLKLSGRRAVVVGGGIVALRKAALLASAGARVHVVAPEIAQVLRRLLAGRLITDGHSLRQGEFEPTDLDGAALVIAATGDRTVNAAVAAAAEARQLPVNVVDDPALCSFIMPAIVERGPLTIAVSSGGLSPVLARLVRTRISTVLPRGLGRALGLAGAWRDRVRAALPDPARRRRFWERLFGEVWRGRDPDPTALLADPDHTRGQLDIVVVPQDDPEAASLRAVRLIAAADLVLYDPAIPKALLDFARRDADRRVIDGNIEAEAALEIEAGHSVVALVPRL
ncbi:MAG TPA: NAD(P)-dependent oxidoreductase [Stellaceae bacterium]|nr:NAD(P)-dependent oxidoreductase [Stellaceae bacterium]